MSQTRRPGYGDGDNEHDDLGGDSGDSGERYLSGAIGPLQSGELDRTFRRHVEETAHEAWRETDPAADLPFPSLSGILPLLPNSPDLPSGLSDLPNPDEAITIPGLESQLREHGQSEPPYYGRIPDGAGGDDAASADVSQTATGRLSNGPPGGIPTPPLYTDDATPHPPPSGCDWRTYNAWLHSPQGRAYAAAQQQSRQQSQPSQPPNYRTTPPFGSVGSGDLVPAGGYGREDGLSRRLGSGELYPQYPQPAQQQQQQRLRQVPRGWSQAIPGGPQALRQQIDMQREAAMAALVYQSHPYAHSGTPANVTQLAQYTPVLDARGHRDYGLSLYLEPHLPRQYLALLFPARREIRLSEQLFPQMSPLALERELVPPRPARFLSAHEQQEWLVRSRTAWERYIEPSLMARFVLACLFERWYHFASYVALAAGASAEDALYNRGLRLHPVWGQNQPIAVAFAPLGNAQSGSGGIMSSMAGKTWERWHPKYYNLLWKDLGKLLCNYDQLDAQTCAYLDSDAVRPFAPKGSREWQHGQQHLAPALCERVSYSVQHDLRLRCHGNDVAYHQALREVAFGDFERTLAERLVVPRALVRCRVGGDRCELRSGQDYLHLTDRLCEDSHELRNWRRRAADLYAVTARRDRDSGELVPPEAQVALWLAEPATYIPSPPERRMHG